MVSCEGRWLNRGRGGIGVGCRGEGQEKSGSRNAHAQVWDVHLNVDYKLSFVM